MSNMRSNRAEFLAVIDIFLTDTAKLAHVVLPGVSYAEKDGTFPNTERNVLRVRKAVEPVGEARPDWQIICDFSTRFGPPHELRIPERDFRRDSDRGSELWRASATNALRRAEYPWPCPSTDHPGTPILHTERFTRGKGLFHAIEYRPPEELIDDEFPIQLTTGRYFPHYHTGTMTRNSPTLHGEMPEGHVEINPLDAAKLGLKNTRRKIVSRRGEVVSKVLLTDLVRSRHDLHELPLHGGQRESSSPTRPSTQSAKYPNTKSAQDRSKK